MKLCRVLAATICVALLAFCFDAVAQRARPGGGGSRGSAGRHAIPEFDPAAAGAVCAVVAGGALLVARRRKR